MPDLASFSTAALWAFLQVFARTLALFSTAPVFGAREVPPQVRIGLAAVLSLAIVPVIRPALSGVPASTVGVIAALASQAAIGALIGFVVSLLFTAIRSAGDLLDFQLGFTQAAALNPDFGGSATPIAEFQYRLSLVLYLAANGHWVLIAALVRSFAALPASHLTLGADALGTLTDLTGQALISGVLIAAPALAVLVLTDVGFAFLGRVMPQMQIYTAAMPAKLLAGLAVIALLLPAFASSIAHLFGGAPDGISALLKGLR
jgi:flagellar biosynthetic protein FliR